MTVNFNFSLSARHTVYWFVKSVFTWKFPRILRCLVKMFSLKPYKNLSRYTLKTAVLWTCSYLFCPTHYMCGVTTTRRDALLFRVFLYIVSVSHLKKFYKKLFYF